MNLSFLKKIILLITLISSFQILAKTTNFGTGADMDKLLKISSILATPTKYIGELTTISGTIVKVCKKRGCWMELAADKKYQTLTIKVPDGKMVFPMSAIGKTAYATGTLTEMKLDLEKTRAYLAHRAQENQTEFDGAEITEAMTFYRFSPVGVTIAD